jgi:hypothetical protein
MGYFRHELSTRQKSEIRQIYSGMQVHIPQTARRKMSAEYLAALYIWHIVEADIVTFDALNLAGLDAWKSANDQIYRAVLRARRLETSCDIPDS